MIAHTTTIPDQQWHRVQHAALLEGLTPSAFIRQAVAHHVRLELVRQRHCPPAPPGLPPALLPKRHRSAGSARRRKVRFPNDLWRAVLRQARRHNQPAAGVIRQAIEHHLGQTSMATFCQPTWT